MNNKFVLEQFLQGAIAFATSEMADADDELEWNVLMVLHADLYGH